MSSSFRRLVYSEIEEIGWEHLVRLGEEPTTLSFRIFDEEQRVHVLEILLDKNYPKCRPSISADVPYVLHLNWSMNSRLTDVVQQFQKHLEKLRDFWSMMDNLDKSLWVVDPRNPSRAATHRQINIGNDCFIMLFFDAYDPKSLPECRFLGSDSMVTCLRKVWRRNCKKWMKENTVAENLTSIFEFELPGPPDIQKNDQQLECGICYAQYLPTDEELGAKSGSGTDHACDNTNCSRAFHSVCLAEWLRSLSTRRQSFNVLFGNCPYCSEPVAVKINDKE